MSGKLDIGARNGSLAAVPDLDAIARHPEAAIGLPRAVVMALLLRAAAAQSALAAALAAETGPVPAAQPDRMLTIEEAAVMLRRDRRWIYRHADSLPFIRRVSPKSLLISENQLRQWLERRRP